MSDKNENVAAITVEDLIFAQAIEKANKPARAKKEDVLIALVAFANKNEKLMTHFETRFPSKNASALNTLIRSNSALNGVLVAVENENLGTCIANITVPTVEPTVAK